MFNRLSSSAIGLAVLLNLVVYGGPLRADAPAHAEDKLVCQVTDWAPVWNDSGSGAHRDIQMWRPAPDDAIYLGMSATGLYGVRPASMACDFRHTNPDLLAPALRWETGWWDAGSGADQNGAIYVPICPQGFDFLGHAAIGTYDGYVPTIELVAEHLRNFRCVRNDLIQSRVPPTMIWNDQGSGGDNDVSIWSAPAFSVVSRHLNALGLPAAEGEPRLLVVGDFFWAQANYNPTRDQDGRFIDPARVILREPHIEPAEMKAMLARSLPTVIFEPRESYFPTNAPDLLANMELAPFADCTASDRDRCWLQLKNTDRDRLAGDLEQARVYLKILRKTLVTEVQVWFLYAYNGTGALRVEVDDFGSKAQVDISLAPCGHHEGDWEHVTYEFGNHTRAIDRIFYSQHDGGVWLLGSNGTPPQVFASRNGHASYSEPIDAYSKGGTYTIGNLTLGAGLVNYVHHDGQTPRIAWQTNLPGVAQIIDARDLTQDRIAAPSANNPLSKGRSMMAAYGVTEPDWMANQVDWGRHETPDLADVQRQIDGNVGDSVAALVEALGELPQFAVDKITESITHYIFAELPAKDTSDCFSPSGPTPPWMKPNWNGTE